MRFKIVYDAHGRLRVRCGDYAFSESKAYGLQDRISALSYIKNVTVNYRTGSILTEYENGYHDELLSFLKEIKLPEIPDGEIPITAETDKRFYSDLTFIVCKRVFNKMFLPIPIRHFITVCKSVKYIVRGLDSLLSCNVNVAVLDGTSVGVSLASGNYSTASSIMFHWFWMMYL